MKNKYEYKISDLNCLRSFYSCKAQINMSDYKADGKWSTKKYRERALEVNLKLSHTKRFDLDIAL